MLKVTEHGVTITLNGKTQGDGLFWFATALLIGAVGVVFAMSLLSVKFAIGSLGLLIVAIFVFNRMRQTQKQQSTKLISTGVIDIRAGMITHNNGFKQDRTMIQTTDLFESHGTSLSIFDANEQKKCHVSGFDNAKEVDIMQQVLQGKSLHKRNVNIKMNSTESK